MQEISGPCKYPVSPWTFSLMLHSLVDYAHSSYYYGILMVLSSFLISLAFIIWNSSVMNSPSFFLIDLRFNQLFTYISIWSWIFILFFRSSFILSKKIFLTRLHGMWDLNSLIRNWTMLPAVEVQSLNHWTIKEVSILWILIQCYHHLGIICGYLTSISFWHDTILF